MLRLALRTALLVLATVPACTVANTCTRNADCPTGRFCVSGTCATECTNDDACIARLGAGARCTVFGMCVAPIHDAGSDGGGSPPSDSGLRDVGVGDAGAIDAGTVDAGTVDAGAIDAGAVDGGSADAGNDAALSSDAGRDGGPDAGHDGGTDAAVTLPTPLNETDVAAEADFCDVQFPLTLDVAVSTASASVYGQLYESGRTDTTVGGAAPGVLAQLGYGPMGSDPRTSTAWSFHAATFNVETGTGNNNDEYVSTLTIATAGTYAYAYRFSFDGGASFTYCDTATGDGGAGSNSGLTFMPASLGVVTVH